MGYHFIRIDIMKKYDVKLVELPKSVLRKESLPVEVPFNDENTELAEKMLWHMKESIKPNSSFRPAVGVAAVQYGILKQIFCVHIVDDDKKTTVFSDVLANPKIIAQSESQIAISIGEGCLSVNENDPGQEGLIKRSNRIRVSAFSYKQGKEITIDASSYLAIVLQHEMDHLKGKLFIDHIDKKNPWKKEKDLLII